MKKIPAIIEVVEQLGDETILYCKIDGIKQNIIVKSPFQGRVETNKSIKLTSKEYKILYLNSTINSINENKDKNEELILYSKIFVIINDSFLCFLFLSDS